MNRIYFLLIIYFYTINGLEYTGLGCFKNINTVRSKYLPLSQRIEDCAISCLNNYYRYFNFYDGSCTCSNFLGERVVNVTCDMYCSKNNCDRNISLTNAYPTGNLVPGPPRNLRVINISSNSCRFLWEEPESYVTINGYVVKTEILKTFSSYPRSSLERSFGNNSFQTELPNLLPATKYNISIYALSTDGFGASASIDVVTKLADPENLPPHPEILSKDDYKMKVKLTSVTNNNGPISAYRIVVVKSDDNQGFQENNVMSYTEAQKLGLSYYVAAEISFLGVSKTFTVGDGKRYGPFYNAPLDPDVNYNILVGLVSSFNGETKVAYSEASGYHNGISILNVYKDEATGDSPAVIIGLSVAIGLLTFLLITGIIGFIILKSRVVNRRQRLSENQELTLQGPMIEVENNGYIHEEDHIPAISHYRNLKQKVRTIPSSQLKIEPTNLLGVGKFGKVNTGTLHENENMSTVTCYSIFDKKMNQETRKGMLQELDVLIKTGKHDNVVSLIGTSETRDVVIVVIEYNSMNLKDLLLGSRDHLPGMFSNMTEKQALKIAVGICRGMAHLHSLNIIHKQLCARSVLISNGYVPKIGSFGLAQYFSHNKIPDYTRWTALEVFKGHPYNSKCDVWSFACVLWEIIALGGTPYGNIPNNNEIPDNLSKGIRLPQLRYVSDDLYQIMLDCWQLVPDERPKFADLIESIEIVKENQLIPAISFKICPNFQYEQFYPNMELSVRPVF